VRSLAWTGATTAGFVVGGALLHSPGAIGLGQYAFEWDLSAALFGAMFGAVVGAFTGFLQTRTIAGPSGRFIIAAVVAVAVAHALADGAPATWGVSVAAALSGIAAAVAFGWATRRLDWRALALQALAWWSGWVGGVAVLGVVTPVVGYGTVDHLVIAAVLGLAWGAATSPAVRSLLGQPRVAPFDAFSHPS
jgi:hypothetical protein